MSIKIEINGVMTEFSTMAEATKAHSAAQAAIELKPAVDIITKDNAEITAWILDNRTALMGITKSDAAAVKKELADHLAATGDAWFIANADRISIAMPKLSTAELAAKIASGVKELAKGDEDLAVFVTANYEAIKEAVKPKLNEAAAAGRDLYLADCKAAKEISAAHGNACRAKYALYKAAVADGTVEEFVKGF
jgi:hypothetical protein